MAAQAADKEVGPNILKIRTFSSRLAVEKAKKEKALERTKRIPKDLHKLLAESYYLPLCCRTSLVVSSHHQPRATNSLFEPHLLRLNLQTLIVILTTLGPNALQLRECTRETLMLMSALHHLPVALDAIVLPALLQLLLSILDLNIAAGRAAEENLISEFGQQTSELVAWTGQLDKGNNIPAIDKDDELGGAMPWTVVAAAVQVKWYEIGKKYQGRILGLLALDGFDEF